MPRLLPVKFLIFVIFFGLFSILHCMDVLCQMSVVVLSKNLFRIVVRIAANNLGFHVFVKLFMLERGGF